MHIHVRIRRWVVWWFYVGVICGVVALVNILGRNDLSRAEVRLILAAGVFFWLLGGLVCYATEGIRIERPSETIQRKPLNEQPRIGQQTEWHAASDFLLPGNRKSLIHRDYGGHYRGH